MQSFKVQLVRRPSRCDARGLYDCFERALTYVGVTDWLTKLVPVPSISASETTTAEETIVINLDDWETFLEGTL